MVDLRNDFPLETQSVSLVATSDETLKKVAIFKINPETRLLGPLSLDSKDFG
jgi:myo-inositol-hexaphosphate 3-phosphohydrolase